MKNKKLNLKKRTIAILSEVEAAKLVGGAAFVTTSVGECTGFLCCETNPGPSAQSWCETQNTCSTCSGYTCDDHCA